MSDVTMSAQIIPFPQRGPAVQSEDGHERLRRALLNLDAAVAGQREAVAAWRSAISDLGAVMSGLGESMQRYRGSLDKLDRRVNNLHAQAVQLERAADTAMAASPR
jgi:ABC-type transporter Mla subunit MlaD